MATRRKAVPLSLEKLVREEPLRPGQTLPLVLRPTTPGVDLATWVRLERTALDARLLEAGAILFRGFEIASADRLAAVAASACDRLVDWSVGFTQRSRLRDKVYSSTEYPPEHPIPPHNELAFAREWPRRLLFCCLVAPASGGETPLTDCRRVLDRLSGATRSAFEHRGLTYVRNFHGGSGAGFAWSERFGTSDRAAVEERCRRDGVRFTWRTDGGLRIEETRAAVRADSRTGRSAWFNQLVGFHPSVIDRSLHGSIERLVAREDLPAFVTWGDGAEIDSAVIDEVRAAMDAETIAFPWEAGDVLLLDNLFVAHGRRPFHGPRRIVVAMGDPEGSLA